MVEVAIAVVLIVAGVGFGMALARSIVKNPVPADVQLGALSQYVNSHGLVNSATVKLQHESLGTLTTCTLIVNVDTDETKYELALSGENIQDCLESFPVAWSEVLVALDK